MLSYPPVLLFKELPYRLCLYCVCTQCPYQC